MPSFTDLYATLAVDPRIRGHRFEPVAGWFLSTDPGYRGTIKKAWSWDAWPGRWGADAGNDLVAETRSGGAVQVKAYDKKNAISEPDVDKFRPESAREVFSYRLLLATADKSDKTARRTIDHQIALPAQAPSRVASASTPR